MEFEDQRQPIDQLTYFNILAQSILHINSSIMSDMDARDAAENLLTDLPKEWNEEIKEKVNKIGADYNITISNNNALLASGIRESVKMQARREIDRAGKKYARDIKNVVITLLQEKDLLYQTKKAIEHGSLSLYKLSGLDTEDDG